MNIATININQQTNTVFSAKRNDYITKKILEQQKKKITNDAEKAILTSTVALTSALSIDEIMEFNGISYCKPENDTINVSAGYNGGFYTIKTKSVPSELAAKNYIIMALEENRSLAGGLANYIDMVKDIKRQDIIQKGLKIHTYELDSNVSKDDKKAAAYKLGKQLNYGIGEADLFFVDGEAFFYDKTYKTAYGINLHATKSNIKPVIRVCKFRTDNQGNATGFYRKDWDVYQWQITENEYSEQLVPSEKIPPIVNSNNNKLFAEAFRFGNTKIHDDYRLKINTKKVLEHLSQRVGITNADENDLQFTKFYNQNKNVESRICYFDSTTGRSFVYNTDGKYMYQLEYNKDSNGNIIACSRF